METAVLHYPRLDTVIMVEDAIQKSKIELSKNGLWRTLPKQVQYQTFNVIIQYLEKSNKITFSKENKIVWIASNQKLDSLVKKGKKL
ncbi:MAG: hypothetical protein Q7R70_06850 [Candidatus Diapherotrites archaeon]|nr:hypothetical protein [Candidatus Diapherotrites archaeon]